VYWLSVLVTASRAPAPREGRQQVMVIDVSTPWGSERISVSAVVAHQYLEAEYQRRVSIGHPL
jgi:hypothetical protein